MMTSEVYPWQQQQWQVLQDNMKCDRVPHALLLTGQVGLGKQVFSQRLAQALLCDTQTACRHCKSCHLFTVGNHPDFYHLVATGEKIQSIKVEQIRQLIQAVVATPAISGRQIVLIEQADLLNTAASNALLKTLEEPMGSVVLILVSSDRTRLPPTIRSRCRTVLFQVPDPAVVESWVQQKNLTLLDFRLRMHLAEGSPLLAISAEIERHIFWRESWVKRLLDLFSQQKTVVEVASEVMSDTEPQLLVLYRLVSDMIQDDFMQGDYHRGLKELKSQRDLVVWFEWLEKIQATIGLVRRQVALNQQLLWESLLLALIQKQPRIAVL